MNYKKHTVEGSQDFLFKECFIKKSIEEKLKTMYKLHGYFEIETPTMEFYDVFAEDRDIISTETMFKFYDQLGRILVLRPDMTVPIARVAATKLREENCPLRISYSGKMFRFREAGFGGQKELSQLGTELLGVLSPEADAEIISMAINSLLAAGFDNFQIDIGQVEFFKGLMENGEFTEGEIEAIRSLIDKKDMLGVEQILKKHEIGDDLKEIILNLPSFFGNIDIIEKIKAMKLNKNSFEAICYLEKVVNLIKDNGLERYITIDLGMVQKLNYYTGVIFKGFTYGVGFPILSGGRYDTLIGKFGNDCPAVGFSINIDMVMEALQRQSIELPEPKIDVLLGCKNEIRGKALILAKILREKGFIVETDILNSTYEDLKQSAESRKINTVIYVKDKDIVEVCEKEKNDCIKNAVSQMLGVEE